MWKQPRNLTNVTHFTEIFSVACTDLSRAVDLRLTWWFYHITTNRILLYSLQHLLGLKCEEQHFQKVALWIYNKHRKNVNILRSTVRNLNIGHDLSTPVPWPLTRTCDLWKWSPLIIRHDTSSDTAVSIKLTWPSPLRDHITGVTRTDHDRCAAVFSYLF